MNKFTLKIILLCLVSGLLGAVLVFIFLESSATVVIKETKQVVYEESISEIIKESSKSIVTILASANKPMGTGVIISENGYILTHSRNIYGNKIQTKEEKEFLITKTIKDPDSDLVILIIDNPDNIVFQPMVIQRSNNITAGQRIVVIGNSFEQWDPIIMTGIITKTGKDMTYNPNIIQDFNIEIDTFISSKDSGGALLNLSGELLGITIPSTEAKKGSAIPTYNINAILKSLDTFGEIRHVNLGVTYEMLNADKEIDKSQPIHEGAKIINISPNSIAAEYDIQKNDIIMKIDKYDISHENTLYQVLRNFIPGETIQLKILRYNEEAQKNIENKSFNEILEEQTITIDVVLK